MPVIPMRTLKEEEEEGKEEKRVRKEVLVLVIKLVGDQLVIQGKTTVCRYL